MTMHLPQLLSEPPGAGLQSEEEIGTIAKEARIPVMTNQADDIDDLAGEPPVCPHLTPLYCVLRRVGHSVPSCEGRQQWTNIGN